MQDAETAGGWRDLPSLFCREGTKDDDDTLRKEIAAVPMPKFISLQLPGHAAPVLGLGLAGGQTAVRRVERYLGACLPRRASTHALPWRRAAA